MSEVTAESRGGRRVSARDVVGRGRGDAVFWSGLAVVVAIFFAGAWQRRWIADDGLIVLRTVRNLVAGNGPVFNAGERVESNTSTLWTYLIYGTHEVVGYRLELVSLGLALTLSMLAVACAMLGARVMYRGTRRAPAGGPMLLLPFGVLVYVMLPPARDFASSGLETGLVICWIGVMWLGLQLWARSPHREGRFGLPAPGTAAIAFIAGLGPLVRPEMALAAAVFLAMMAASRQSWRHLGWLVVIAGTVPVVYQLWRMSYYALPYPLTAVAKDAGGAKWDKGAEYLWDLLAPYVLLLPLVAVLVAGLVALWARTAPRRTAGASSGPPLLRLGIRSLHRGSESGPAVADSGSGEGDDDEGGRLLRLRGRVRSTPVVTVAFLVVALVMLLYVTRVGGDFMHGRVLLPSLFLILLPVAVVPLPVGPARGSADASVRRVAVPVTAAAWLVVIGWAVTVQVVEDPFREEPESITSAGIVDERQFYIQRTGHRHPLLADDYLDFPRMRALVRDVSRNETGAVFLPVPGFQDRWDVVAYDHPMPGLAPFELPEDPVKTVVFLNLGMTSMNLPLDVGVYDTVGLASPLAAHTDRMEDGRIGHDKFLPYDWVLAQRQVIENPVNFPRWIDVNWVNQAEVALQCPATQALIESYSAPLTPERRWSNLVNAFSFAEYRINRIPAYEVQRCGLPMPEEVEKYQGTR
ncbi:MULTISPECIES: arabinosyltransferase [Dietzia]|uniref:Arabinosyltransferase n=1 Tax=Dietzia cinnamea TaxID=321318 RepID=A0AAW5QAA3_9ACTN|nr:MULTISPECIES: arabinosyltransferase [Dietzia]MCT1640491.1 arabinosyltransferase [Dietzia cinnamea]MCT1712562.1 arabinosyltransferase [Dietzia cinnamea]MCT1864933.1 arabinosyltransferase [Dietzia cinnamea]MCT2030540.1 arabinosyltransferase [Dietzia cinnamea]MCT2034415.1 arabinosyltransferase [Dietzia cinnamea]